MLSIAVSAHHRKYGQDCTSLSFCKSKKFQVKTCFMVLDDDGSNEVTSFEFKQHLGQCSRNRRRVCSCAFVFSAKGMPCLWLQRSRQVGL